MTDIPSLRALLAAATPGPWVVHNGQDGQDERCYGVYSTSNRKIIETDAGFYPPSNDDASLIVTLVNAAKPLLDELERLRAEVEMHEACDEAEMDRSE